MTFEAGETAVVVAVPAAEQAVDRWRQRFDSSAPFGVPAHVTLCYPFVASALLTPPALADLRSLIAASAVVSVTFGRLNTFPGVLYMEPNPDQPFRTLTEQLLERWPDYPPYGGQFDPIPHLTVTDSADEIEMATAAADVAGRLPICTTLSGASLLKFDGFRWLTAEELPFRG